MSEPRVARAVCGSRAVCVLLGALAAVAACDDPAPTTPVAVNAPPVFTSTAPADGLVGQPYIYDAVATDPDGDALIFSLTSAPAWLSLTGATSTSVRVEGTPTLADAGSVGVVLTVSDAQASTDQAFNVQVDTLATPMILVTTAADSGPGSLRQALADAEVRTVITFAAGVGVISVPAALGVDRSIRIVGPGPGALTLAATGVDRIFEVRDSTSVVEISGLTMTNGFSDKPGGAVHSRATLLLRNIRFLNNRSTQAGGAVHSHYDLTIEETVFETNSADGEGGALDTAGTLSMADTRFMANMASGNGGAFRNRGGATLFDVEFMDNTSAGNGAAIANEGGGLAVTLGVFIRNHAEGHGGGLYNSGTSTISTSLFLANESHLNGGGIRTTGRLDGSANAFVDNWAVGHGGALSSSVAGSLRSSTLFQNRGGIRAGGLHTEVAFDLKNTVIAGNVTNSTNDPDVSGPISSQGYLFIQNLTGAILTGDTTGNLSGMAPGFTLTGVDAAFTLVLSDTSPVLDAGSCEGETGDRNGSPRPVDLPGIANVDDACDLGAYEKQS